MDHYCSLREKLLSQIQFVDDDAVALEVVVAEVLEQPPSLPDELQKPALGIVVFLVGLEMLGQIVDAFGDESDLHFRVAGVGLGFSIQLQDFNLPILEKSHCLLLSCLVSSFSACSPAVRPMAEEIRAAEVKGTHKKNRLQGIVP
jgi:hypothetical protein